MSVKYQHYSRASAESWRYQVLNMLCGHSPWIDPLLPIFGNKSLFETLLTLGLCILAMIIFFLVGATSVGNLTDLVVAFLVLLALRKANPVTLLTGASFEHCLFFHKAFGIISVMGMIIHGCREGLGSSSSGLVLGLAMLLTASSYLIVTMKMNFQYFYYLHIGTFSFIIILALLHGAKFSAFAGLLWLVDLSWRYAVAVHKVTAKARLLTPTLIRVEFPKVYEHSTLGEYVFLAVKELNRWEYHPYSLCSSPHSTTTIFYIQVSGDWTKKLKQLTLDSMDGEDGEGVIGMSVEGPYGSLSVDLLDHDRYPVVLLIAGGIGVTPLLNILSTLLSQCQKGRANNLVKVLFVWSVRDQAVGDSIYQDFLIPIVEDSKEIHQSYAYTSSLSHTNHLDQVHGGALNIPRKDIFTYSLHCTDPAYLSSDPVVPAANQVVGATNQAKSNEIKLQANREIKSSLAGSSSPKKMTTSPLHQSSSSSSSLAALGGNSGKVDDTPLWMPSRMSVPEYFTQAMSVLKKPVDGEKKMQRVAVFACGPEPLVEEVRLVQQRMNRNATHSHVNFDLHEEMFFY